jgi:alpha-L-rhamnosidase
MKRPIIVTILLLALLPFMMFGAEVQIANLKTEYSETPLGIDVEHPRFSWQMQITGNTRGNKQKAYQLVVTNESNNVVWDSGKKEDDVSLNIPYKGKPLTPTTRYNWKVDVWDHNNIKHSATSWFETGLMNASTQLTAWSGAKWIGGSDDDMVLSAHYLPVFKVDFSVQMDKTTNSTKAGFVYGANDMRLMDANKNMYHLAKSTNESYLLVELDIAPLKSNELAQLNIYRVGYHPDDKKDLPLKSFSIPAEILSHHNHFEKHTVSFSSDLGYSRFHLDGRSLGEVNLNPLGQGGDFIAFPVVGDIGFAVPAGQSAAFSDVQIRNFRSPSNVLFTENLTEQTYDGIFSGYAALTANNNVYEVKGGKTGAFIVANPSRNSMPMLRTTFMPSLQKIAKARLYVTARGIYEIYMNGKRVGDDWFNPGLTQYNKTHLYQTYDVTTAIQPGQNALGAILGEGWWSGGATYLGANWNFFGDRQSLLAKLVITYTNGKEDIIVSNPASWTYFNDGPVVYGSFFQGEIYDAQKEAQIENWSTASYNANNWKPANEIVLDGHVNNEVFQNRKTGETLQEVPITGQFGQTVKAIKQLTAISFDEVRPRVYVYDMGQNMVGVPNISLSGLKPGTKVVLRFAEVKYPNLPQYKGNEGMIMLENIRAAMAQEIYIAKGGDETIAPRFTSHGYRFIEITGIEAPLPLEAVKGTVISSIHELASHYETSNPKVNKLWENITWSTLGNFVSIPTDCPQRNERLGWSGDISVFSRTATYLADAPQFLRRQMLAMRDLQREDGRFPDVAPVGVGFGELLWGSAAITVAWESYQQYADKHLLDEHYGATKKYVEYLIKDINPETGILKEKERTNWASLGDWLSPEYEKSEKVLLWESYLIYNLELMGKMATALGKPEDAEWFRNIHMERKKFFNLNYIDKETGKTVFRGKTVDTQTSYALPLAFGIFDETNKGKAVENFIATIARENRADDGTVLPPYSLMTGFIGTSWINNALSENGHADVAYRLLQQTHYPSWLYSVEQGATTIWERLNSYTNTDGFGGNNRMNSFNHYSFGAVGAWMYSHSLGIARDENSPGFKHFILQPEPDATGQMTSAKGHYDSMYGRIESGWEQRGNSCRYRFVVPANTTATVYIPAQNEREVTENNKRASKSKGVKFVGMDDGKAVYEVGSGSYNFAAPNTKGLF